jgi:hypothetical protein
VPGAGGEDGAGDSASLGLLAGVGPLGAAGRVVGTAALGPPAAVDAVGELVVLAAAVGAEVSVTRGVLG